MKLLVILTSSIFYLLGLKLTHEVKINQPSAPDSISITAPIEAAPTPNIEQENNQLPSTEQGNVDSIGNCNSSQNTAPWSPIEDNSDAVAGENA